MPLFHVSVSGSGYVSEDFNADTLFHLSVFVKRSCLFLPYLNLCLHNIFIIYHHIDLFLLNWDVQTFWLNWKKSLSPEFAKCLPYVIRIRIKWLTGRFYKDAFTDEIYPDTDTDSPNVI